MIARLRGGTDIPRAAVICAAIAFVNAAVWAAVTPVYWAPDEGVHAGYAQHLAETGRLPNPRPGDDPRVGQGLAPEQVAVFAGLPWSIEGEPSWSVRDDRRLRRTLQTGRLGRSRPGQALYVDVHPPLYYLLQTVPYRIAYDADYLDRLMAMRLLSALLGGITVLFVFLFLREALPSVPWAWTAGGLVVAFQPVLGFMAGGVNNDVLAYAASAGIFYGVARGFRRGLDLRSAAIVGAAVGVGILGKANVIALLPGVVFGMAVLVLRAPHGWRGKAAMAACAAAIAVVPWIVWTIVRQQALGDAPAPAAGLASGSVGGGSDALREQASYIWQALLPRLPFMVDQIPWYPPWETFFKGFVGRFGWFEYGFPTAWYFVALAVFAALVALAARELAGARSVLRARWAELAAYGMMVAGLVLALEIVAYRYHLGRRDAYFEQARYLLPLLPLYGVLVSLAVRGAGARFGPAVGGSLVVLAVGHSLFSQLLTIARFYA